MACASRAGTSFPTGIGVSAFLFIEENAVNPSFLSRSDLVRELLAPPSQDAVETAPHVGDREPPCYGPSANEPALSHKLGVARELLLRDLHAQMCSGPIMHTPQALRDWLRLHCANLEHEVF